MEEWKQWEAAAIVAISFVTARLGALFVPLTLLVGFNLMDYVTGLLAAPYRGQARSSYKGFLGIAKKICMWLLVGVGAGMDLMLVHTGAALGIHWPFKLLVACLVCIWLLANEMISVVENISEMGVAVPPFLLPLIHWVRRSAERQGKTLKQQGEEKRKKK